MENETIFQNPPQNPPVLGAPPPPPQKASSFPPESNSGEAKGRILSIRGIKFVVGLLAVLLVGFVIIFSLTKLFGDKDQKVTLTYWGLWEDKNVLAPIIADFERQNPNVKIDYSKQDIKDYRERLMTRIANGDGPDIFKFHNSWYPMISEILLPLPESVITREEFSKNFYQVSQRDLVKNGAIYGIPLHIDTLSLYVNRDMLEAAGLSPPKTWEEFRNAAYELTVKDEEGNIKTSGVSLGTFENVSHAPDIISLLLIQNGVDIYNPKASQRLYDGLTFYASFAENDQAVWSKGLDNSILSFSKGDLAMFFGYSWDYFAIKAINPQLSFAIVPTPQLDSENPVGFASYWADGVSSKSKNQKEALAFMEFLTQESTQEKLYTEESKVRLFGELYSNVNLSQRLKDNKEIYVFLEQAPYARSSYFVDNTFDNGLNERLNNYLKDAINSILSGSSAESAAETLIQGYGQVLKQYENEKN